MGYRLEWENLKVNKEAVLTEGSNRLSIVMHYDVETRTGWTYSSELGADGINSIVNERRWEPRAGLGFSSQRGKRLELYSSFSVKSYIREPVVQLEQEIAWTRDNQFQAGLRWNMTRTFVMEPVVRYRFAELFSFSSGDTKNRTVAYQLGTRWSISRVVSLETAAVAETIKSTNPINDLTENSLILTLSGELF
jgi:hypothetical protein